MNISNDSSQKSIQRYSCPEFNGILGKVGDTIVSPRLSRNDVLRQGLESLIKSSVTGVADYYDTGLALAQIKTSELYKPEFSNFYRYCWDKFGLSEPRIKQLIRAVKVTDSVKQIAQDNNVVLSEGLCRELHKIKDEEMRSQCLKNAAEKGVITAKSLHQEYREMVLKASAERQPPIVPKIGSVVRLSTKNNPELCPFNNLWGVVEEEYELSVSVQVLGAKVESVHPRELISSEDLDLDFTFANNLLNRLNTIYKSYEVPTLIKQICILIGSRPFPLLEEIEDKILTTIEQELNLT